jgi:hypothetical protein
MSHCVRRSALHVTTPRQGRTAAVLCCCGVKCETKKQAYRHGVKKELQDGCEQGANDQRPTLHRVIDARLQEARQRTYVSLWCMRTCLHGTNIH